VQKKSLYMLVAVVLAIIVIGSVVGYVLLTTSPPVEKILVVGTTDDEVTFDPADSYDYFSINIIQNTMAMLLTYDTGTTNLIPDLLSQVPTLANGGISSDGLNYTLHLRANLKFENGNAINASVLKYSLDRVVFLNGEPAFLVGYIKGSQEYWNIGNDVANLTRKASAWLNYTMQGVEIVDATTVKVHLRAEWSPFTSLLAFSITAPVDPNSFRMTGFYPNLTVSSGPYRLTKYTPHQRYEFTANANYYGTPPKTAKVTMVRYTTAVDLKLAIQTGEIDVAYRSLLPQDFATLKTNANLRTMQGDSPFIRYLVFNMCSAADVTAGDCPRTTVFSGANGLLIRKALAYATNRTDISNSAYNGTVSNLYSLIPMGMFGHDDAFKQVYGSTVNVAAAQALLTQAGYSTSSKLPITLWYTPSHYGDPEIFVAQTLKRSWEATGMVTVTIDQQDWASYRTSWRAGTFDVFLLGWFPDYFDPDDYVYPFLHWASGGSASFGNWYHNATMDAKIEAEAATADPTARATLFGEIQDGLAADVPYLPLFQSPQTVVFKPNISGIVLDPIQFFRLFIISVA